MHKISGEPRLKHWLAQWLGSVRARYLFLVLITLLAPLGLLLHSASQARALASSEAAADAMDWGELAAAEHQNRVDAGHQMLEVLAEVPALRGQDGAACSQMAARLMERYQLYANLGAATLDGQVFCSGIPVKQPVNWAHEAWFRRAVETQNLVVGDYEMDPIAHQPVLVLAHPLLDAAGQVETIVAVSLPLDWLARYAAGSPTRQDESLAILDEFGTVMVSFPNPELALSQPAHLGSLPRAIQIGAERATAEAVGEDGVRRLYAYVRLSSTLDDRARYVRVGVPTSMAYAAADRQLYRDLALLGLAALVALGFAWWLGDLLVLRPLGMLRRATQGLRDGDLSVRTGPPYDSGEFGKLGQAFDEMAQALAEREEEQRAVQAEVHVLNRELERRVRQRTDQLEAANRVSAAIAANVEPQELLTAVIDTVLPALNADVGWVLVASSAVDGRGAVPVARGIAPAFATAEAENAPATCPVCEPLLRGRQAGPEPQVIQICPRLPVAVQEASGLHSHLGQPLVTSDRLLGVLNVGWRTPHTVTPEERGLLAAIGRQVSVALEKADLYTASRRRAQRLATLNAIGQALTATLDLDCVTDTLLGSTGPAVDAAAVGLALVEEPHPSAGEGHSPEGAPVLVYHKVLGAGALVAAGARVAPDSVAQQALLGQRAVLVAESTGQVPVAAAPVADTATSAGSARGPAACLPLLLDGRCIGVLEVARDRPGGLDEEDLQLLAAVASQAAVAIANAQLYRREREQYRRLETSQAQLVQAEKSAALGGLAAALAHEINNPLQSLRANIELITDYPLPEQERTQLLQVARQEIVRLGEIAHRVLSFYRRSNAQREPVQVNDLVERTLLLANVQLKRAQVAVSLDLGAARPVLAVPDQIMQVLLNLILNAVQALDGPGQIRVSTADEGGRVTIACANNGPAIPAESLSQIFAPNFTTKRAGTGLGLFIGRNIISQHGGTLDAANLPDGTGVVFTIRLPAAPPRAAGGAPARIE